MNKEEAQRKRMKYLLKEDENLTFIEDNAMEAGSLWPFKAGTVLDLIFKDTMQGHVIMGLGDQRIFVPLQQFNKLFELVWAEDSKPRKST